MNLIAKADRAERMRDVLDHPLATAEQIKRMESEIATMTAKLAESELEFNQCSSMLNNAERRIEELEQQLAAVQRDASDLTKILAGQQTEHAKQLSTAQASGAELLKALKLFDSVIRSTEEVTFDDTLQYVIPIDILDYFESEVDEAIAAHKAPSTP